MSIKKFTGIFKGITNAGLILLVCSILSSCSTYSNSFACGDARGAACISMDKVDRMIASGEIERFNKARRKCRGRKCKGNPEESIAVMQSSAERSVPIHFTASAEAR